MRVSPWAATTLLLALAGATSCGEDDDHPPQLHPGGRAGGAGKASSGASHAGATSSGGEAGVSEGGAGPGGKGGRRGRGTSGASGTRATGGEGAEAAGGTGGGQPLAGRGGNAGGKATGGTTGGASGATDGGESGVAGAGGEAGEGGAGAPSTGGSMSSGGAGCSLGGTTATGGTGGTMATGGTGGTGDLSSGGTAGTTGGSSAGTGGSGGSGGSSAGTGGTGGGDACEGVTCSGHGACSAPEAIASCACDSGFQNAPGVPTSCVDVDECATDHGGCDVRTSCTNVPGSHACSACPLGYSGTGETGCVPLTCSGAPANPTCACIRVDRDGDDALAAASGGVLPFANLQPAIDFVDSYSGAPTKVCVAEGSACGQSTTYPGPSADDLAMRDGISVYGGYESTAWTRCADPGTPRTVLAPQTGSGVSFGPDVQSPTVLDGFTIARFGSATTTALTLDGAVGAAIASCELGAGAVGSTTSLGVDALNGADATLDSIGMTLASWPPSPPPNQFGIRAVGSRLVVHDADIDLVVDYLDGGQSGTGLSLSDSPSSVVENSTVRVLNNLGSIGGVGVRATNSGGLSLDGTTIAAFYSGAELIDSPGVHWTRGTLTVTSVVSGSLLLQDSPGATIGVAVTSSAGGSVVLRGSAAGTTLGGSLSMTYTQNAVGISVEDCGGDKPTVSMSVDTTSMLPVSDGIRVSGACSPTISSEVTLRLGQASTSFNDPATLEGIRCMAPAKCTVSHSRVAILGRSSSFGFMGPERVDATGIRCDADSCPLIENSVIRGLSNPWELRDSFYTGGGVSAPGATMIRANRIDALCAGGDGFGLYASGAQRIENNIINGPTCGGTLSTASGAGQLARAVGLVGGIDVHSNTIQGNGATDGMLFGQYGCSSTGMRHTDGASTIRNNIIGSGGDCIVGHSFEKTGSGYPAAFENNSLGSYLDAGTLLTSESAINALPGAANNLTSGSYIDAGTTTGAPATDIDGYPRDAHPDVGAHEFTECDVDNGGCDPLTTCTGIPGGHLCGACPSGYAGDGTTGCVDIDECSASASPCPAPSTCANDVGSYHCVCPTGYTYFANFGICTDVDECNQGNGDCGVAACINTEGSHHCGDCPAGYTGTGDTGCQDIDECANPTSCDPLTTCFNYLGTYGCSPCPAGYTGTGETGCVSVCASNGGCDPLTTCTPSGGSARTCGTCPSGYTGTGNTSCQDIDECDTNHGGCDVLTTCTNTPGGRTCGPCPTGYVGDGVTGCHDPSPMVSITVADVQACGLRASGSIDCWGNPDGYYGSAKPEGETFMSVSAGHLHTCALRTDGTAVCWGTSQPGTTPGGTFTAISAGIASDCGLRPNGSVECWGFFGAGTMTAPAGPFVAIRVGGYDACALRADHSVTCWGANLWGGADAPSDAFNSVDLGEVGGCGITTGDELACWGGDDTPGWEVTPPLGTFTAVATGTYGGCAIAGDQTLACWGNDNSGETSPPPGTYKALSFGNGTACAIRTDDAIVCWGDGSSGLLDGPPS